MAHSRSSRAGTRPNGRGGWCSVLMCCEDCRPFLPFSPSISGHTTNGHLTGEGVQGVWLYVPVKVSYAWVGAMKREGRGQAFP